VLGVYAMKPSKKREVWVVEVEGVDGSQAWAVLQDDGTALAYTDTLARKHMFKGERLVRYVPAKPKRRKR
jgi:hypothetical protein